MTQAPRCPMGGQRRSSRPGEGDGPSVEQAGGLWRLRALQPARDLLRARQQTTQAGFTAEYIPQAGMRRRPILIADGPGHDEQRSAVARFFAPAVVRERYTQAIAACADRLLDGVAGPAGFDLDDLALHYTVEVTADIVGLTHEPRRPLSRFLGLSGSRPLSLSKGRQDARDAQVAAMARRLVSFFDQPAFDLSRKDLGRSRRQWMQAAGKGLVPLATFWCFDVRPAVRQRRRTPSSDLLGQLIASGASDIDLLVEAVTYGTAGMVTTREFIAMAAWHLLTTPELAEHYRSADDNERLAVLQEVIRLEPVVGHLYRRVTEPVTITDGEHEVVLQPGDLVDVDVRRANADVPGADSGGADPLRLCPGRPMPPGVRPVGLAFGDGAHKCPGEPLALLEADILLTRLLERDPRLVREPQLGWDDLVSGYELRGMRIKLDG